MNFTLRLTKDGTSFGIHQEPKNWHSISGILNWVLWIGVVIVYVWLIISISSTKDGQNVIFIEWNQSTSYHTFNTHHYHRLAATALDEGTDWSEWNPLNLNDKTAADRKANCNNDLLDFLPKCEFCMTVIATDLTDLEQSSLLNTESRFDVDVSYTKLWSEWTQNSKLRISPSQY